MRRIDDMRYQEYKEGVLNDFGLWEREPDVWTPEHCTNKMLDDEAEYADHPIVGTSVFLWFISLGEYEVRNNILEERVLLHLAYHIFRYENMGRYKSDLTPEEIKDVEKDIAYIKSKVELPELKTYEDLE